MLYGKQQGKSPIGLHFLDIQDVDEMSRRITKYNPYVVHFVFTSPPAVIEVMKRHPEIIGIYSFDWRLWGDKENTYIGGRNNFAQMRRYIAGRNLQRELTPEEDTRDTMGDAFNPVEAVDEFFKAQSGNENYFRFHASDDVKRRLYIYEYNETVDNIDRVRFMREFANRLHEWGLKACLWNGGVGHDPRWDIWRSHGLLDLMKAQGHLIGWHGYFQVIANLEHNTPIRVETGADGKLKQFLARGNFQQEYAARQVYPKTMLNTWTAFRCARHHESLKNMGYGDIKMVATEFGADAASYHITANHVSYAEIGAWQSVGNLRLWQESGFTGGSKSPAQFYAEQIAFAKRQYLEYQDFNLGATIFISGSGHNQINWKAFDVSLIDDVITTEINRIPNFGAVTEPQPEPEPEPQPENGNWLYIPDSITRSDGTVVRVAAVNARRQPLIVPDNVIRAVLKGERLKALGFTRDIDGDVWYKVEVPVNGQNEIGYMSSFWTRIESVNAELPDLDHPDTDEVEQLKAQIAQLTTQLEEANAARSVAQTRVNEILQWYNSFPEAG